MLNTIHCNLIIIVVKGEKIMKYFVKSDWNGFFGLFTNNLTNVLVMASLLTFVVGLPNGIVFGRIIPAVGLSIFLASAYYTYMAVKLARKEGREDVTALPSGTSVPHMFLVVFLVIGPVYWATGDPVLAWSAGVVWALFEGVIELVGSIFGQRLRDVLPRAAMLGSLAGVSITYIALNPAFSVFAVPYIGLVALAIVLLGFVGNIKMPLNIPVGLVAIIIGVLIGWVSGFMSPAALAQSVQDVTFGIPVPSIARFFNGFADAVPFLVAAVPLGIYNFFETIDNCESAAVAGDSYSTREALLADGVTTIIGAIFGNPFPTAVFIGHPGWKKAGARIGYAFLTGLVIFIFAIFGLIGILLNIIPIAAILPILLYIGIVITTQAFTSVQAKYAPAVVMAIIPWLADWTRNAVDIALGEARTSAVEIGYEGLANAGLDYFGMMQLGAGSIVVGILLGTITVYVIDRRLNAAGVTALIAAALTFFGIIHGGVLSINANVPMTLGYLFMAIIFVVFKQFKGEEQNEI
jgi:AGZA family xanthine/uracil permease-like MFS transporter